MLEPASDFTVTPSGDPIGQQILTREAALADKANARRQELRDDIDRKNTRKTIGNIVGPIIAVGGIAVFVVLFSGLYFVVFNVILGGTASFKQVASVVAHSSIITALGAAVGAPVQYLQGTANPMGPFTLSALLPMLDENSFLARFLGFIGVFSIWGVIVTAIGLAVLYRRKTSNIAIGLLLLTAAFAFVGATVAGIFTR